MEVLRTQNFQVLHTMKKMHNSYTEKAENFLTKISHKILCGIHTTVFTMHGLECE